MLRGTFARLRLLAIAALLGLAVAAALAAASDGSPADAGTAVCKLTHRAFAGVCTESVPMTADQTPKEACGEVLRCLNDTRCRKMYCQRTNLRGGWTLGSAEAGDNDDRSAGESGRAAHDR